MTPKFHGDRLDELVRKGLEAEYKERGELIDNMVRARCLPAFVEPIETTEELRNLYHQRLKELGYQT